MKWLRVSLLRLAGSFNQKRRGRDLAEELESHLQLHIDDNVRAGMTPVEARRQALIRLGGIEQTKEIYRDRLGIPLVESLTRDVRYGLRVLRRSPGFTSIAILTLALGIGGTTAVFSVLYGGLLNPFPYRDSHRLAVFVARSAKGDRPAYWAGVSSPEFLDYQEKSSGVFDDVLGFAVGLAAESVVVIGRETPEINSPAYITENTFRVLGVPPLLGRVITPADCKADARVAVIAFNYWRSRFGGEPSVIGRTILLGGRSTTVVGVMPQRFSWGGTELWVPFCPSISQGERQMTPFRVIGRLKPNVSIRQADAEIAELSKALAPAYPSTHPKNVSFGLAPLAESATERFRGTLYTLMGAVGLLLGIACLNAANLFLARITARGRETAIRASLGANRLRIVRQFMIESLLIALAGGGLGCVLARTVLDAFVAYLPPGSIPSTAELTINGPVLLFAFGVAVLSSLLVGLTPAMFVIRKDCVELINAGSQRSGERRLDGRMRNILVVSQVVVSLVLLTGAGLLIRNFFALRHVDLGYNTHQVLSVAVGLPEARYKTSDQKNRYYIEALSKARAVPGVISAAICTPPPMWGIWSAGLEIPGIAGPENWSVQLHLLSDGYHETMGIPLRRGRDFSEQDVVARKNVAVVNYAFASRYFGAVDPLGKEIRLANKFLTSAPNSARPIPFVIIGVSGDSRDNGPSAPVTPQVYVPFTISGSAYNWILGRTALDVATMLYPVRRSIADIDRELPVGSGGGLSNGPMDGIVDSQFTEPRFVLCMLSAFATLGLSLVAIGVYGVLGYAVSRRTQEIGVRMALGARAQDVRWWVLRTGLQWLGIGVGIGVPASVALAKILQNRIWGIKSVDPLTLGAVVVVILAVGITACYFPARRATRVDPMQALRFE